MFTFASTILLEFPPGCKYFYGPHSMDCIRTIRSAVGLADGGSNQDAFNLTSALITEYSQMSLM